MDDKEPENSLSIKEKTTRTFSFPRELEWEFTGPSYEPNHTHFVAPWYFRMYLDGHIEFSARELAAMYRHEGPVDGGPDFDFFFEVKLWMTKQDVENNKPTFWGGFKLARLGYRQKINNPFMQWDRPELQKYIGFTFYGGGRPRIVKVGDAPSIPLPPITIEFP